MKWYPMMGAVSSVVFVQTFKYIVVEYFVACEKCKKRVYYIVRKDPGLFLLNYRVICQLSKSSLGRDGYLIVLYNGSIIKHI